ncbi:MAG: phenylacetate--CoA ligase [Candidatus Brocadiaceae bacterium]|jgi:phenylacetate-CoA ligase
MYMWDPQHESMPREDLLALQFERLRNTIARAYAHVPLYREKMDEAGVAPDQIRSRDDIRRLPFTVKDDFRDNYPYGLLAVPRRDVVRVHASSGTTGKPTVVAYTRRDLETWADLVARILAMAGVRQDSVVQVAFGYGLFTGGFGLHYGIERIGAQVIPAAAGNTRRHLQLIRDLGTTHIVCTPSYAFYLCETAGEMGIDLRRDTSLRIGCFGGEPWSDQMRQQMEETYGLAGYDNYGLSELIGPGVSGECPVRNGMHVFEDHFYAEVIDPDTGEVLPPGEEGELVITSLTREALPVLRYRTRDITSLTDEPCECGRTFGRMARVTGRTDDMLIIRGVNVFPSQIEHAFLEMDGTSPNYQIIVDREGALDTIQVKIEVTEGMLSDEMKDLRRLEQDVQQRLSEALGLSTKITLVEPGSLPRSEGKAERVIDRRQRSD